VGVVGAISILSRGAKEYLISVFETKPNHVYKVANILLSCRKYSYERVQFFILKIKKSDVILGKKVSTVIVSI
jgi:hypothetical protein